MALRFLIERASQNGKVCLHVPRIKIALGISLNSRVLIPILTEALEEAKRRDHRVVGKDQSLFMMHPYSPGEDLCFIIHECCQLCHHYLLNFLTGAPFFLPSGTIVINRLIDYLRGLYREYGYQEVYSHRSCRCATFTKIAGTHAADLQHQAVGNLGPSAALCGEHVFCPGFSLEESFCICFLFFFI